MNYFAFNVSFANTDKKVIHKSLCHSQASRLETVTLLIEGTKAFFSLPIFLLEICFISALVTSFLLTDQSASFSVLCLHVFFCSVLFFLLTCHSFIEPYSFVGTRS
jgi:hypothetical protein